MMNVGHDTKDVERSRIMFERILVPLDGSNSSEKAIPVAAHIARASGGTIVLVSVVIAQVEFGTYTAERTVPLKPGAFKRRLGKAVDYLAGIRETYASDLAGIDTEIDVAAGAASPMIFSAAQLEGVDLIVMCSHGEGGLKRRVFGSIAQEALRHSPVPVLVINEHGTVPPALDATHSLRIVVPLDGSALSETALLPAAQLIAVNAHMQGFLKYVLASHWNPQLFAAITEPLQGEIHLLRVVDMPSVYGKLKSQAHITDVMQEEARQEELQEAVKYVKSVAERCEMAFAGFNLKVSSSVAIGENVAETIVKKAEQAGEDAGYDMIAMATHGKGVLRRLFMGSVTEHVLKTTKLPLLIVHPQQAKTGGEGEEPDDTTIVEVAEVRELPLAELHYELP
jgi:nucleotide-binding universal stress UspA family protein